MKKVGIISGGIVLVLGAFVLFTFVVMWLWNWLMPDIFNLSVITFWQSAGLLVLSKIIFSGFSHEHKCHSDTKRKVWHEKFKSRWKGMPHEHRGHFSDKTNEERQEAESDNNRKDANQ